MEIEGTAHDFPFVSMRGAGENVEEELVAPEKTRCWTETLYPANTSGMEPDGGRIGTVTIVHGRGRDRVPFVAYFAFDDADDVVVVRGDAPGGTRFIGKTTAQIIDGTGDFDGRDDVIEVESTNPQRWGLLASVPGVGLEPTRSFEQALLRRRRLPVPTPGRATIVARVRGATSTRP